MAAADFDDGLVGERDGGDDVVIELDAGSVEFVFGGEWDSDRWILLVGVVEKDYVLAAEASGEEGIPEPPHGLADATQREERVDP